MDRVGFEGPESDDADTHDAVVVPGDHTPKTPSDRTYAMQPYISWETDKAATGFNVQPAKAWLDSSPHAHITIRLVASGPDVNSIVIENPAVETTAGEEGRPNPRP